MDHNERPALNQKDKIRIIIADDSDFIREGMHIILDADQEFEVCGCAANGKEAVALARNSSADIILMDIQMPVMDGIEATKLIVKEDLGKVLILTTFDDYDLVDKAMKNGAKGYLIKNHTPEQLKQMIKAVYSGINVVDQKALKDLSSPTISAASGFQKDLYTKRELEIIELIANGLSNKEIAAKLYISEGTVKNYISTILDKENIEHRTKLAIYYLTGRK